LLQLVLLHEKQSVQVLVKMFEFAQVWVVNSHLLQASRLAMKKHLMMKLSAEE
jgi:hypothetical protein